MRLLAYCSTQRLIIKQCFEMRLLRSRYCWSSTTLEWETVSKAKLDNQAVFWDETVSKVKVENQAVVWNETVSEAKIDNQAILGNGACFESSQRLIIKHCFVLEMDVCKLAWAGVRLTVRTLEGDGFGKRADGKWLEFEVPFSLSRTRAEMKDKMANDRSALPKMTTKLETAGIVAFRNRNFPRFIILANSIPPPLLLPFAQTAESSLKSLTRL